MDRRKFIGGLTAITGVSLLPVAGGWGMVSSARDFDNNSFNVGDAVTMYGDFDVDAPFGFHRTRPNEKSTGIVIMSDPDKYMVDALSGERYVMNFYGQT